MDRVGAGFFRRVDQPIDPQVAFTRRARTNQAGFIGIAHVQRGAVALRVHRDRRQAELAAGARDPDGDLAAVGDQNLFQSE
jgi:hypothetical protein